jgi:hypothetical protein
MVAKGAEKANDEINDLLIETEAGHSGRAV